jgi:hypothetical protein
LLEALEENHIPFTRREKVLEVSFDGCVIKVPLQNLITGERYE